MMIHGMKARSMRRLFMKAAARFPRENSSFFSSFPNSVPRSQRGKFKLSKHMAWKTAPRCQKSILTFYMAMALVGEFLCNIWQSVSWWFLSLEHMFLCRPCQLPFGLFNIMNHRSQKWCHKTARQPRKPRRNNLESWVLPFASFNWLLAHILSIVIQQDEKTSRNGRSARSWFFISQKKPQGYFMRCARW